MASDAPRFPELVSQIIIVSTLLHHAVLVTSPPRLKEAQIYLSDVWNALAFLLGLGGTDDRAAHEEEVAVAGTVEAGAITVFISRNTGSREDGASPQVFSSRDPERGWTLLNRSYVSIKRGALNFEAHIQDVLHVIRYFSAPPERRYEGLAIRCLFTFIVVFSYSELLSRIEDGDKLWIHKSTDAESRGEESTQMELEKKGKQLERGQPVQEVETSKKGTPKKGKSKKGKSKTGKQVERAQPVQECETRKHGTQSRSIRKVAPVGQGKLAEQAQGEQAEPADLNANHLTTHIYHVLRSTPQTHIRPPGRSVSFRSFMRSDLERAGLTPSDCDPSDSELTYSGTNQNASQWAKVVMDSVGDMRGTLDDLRKDTWLSGFALSDKYNFLFDATHVLHEILACSHVVEALLSPQVLVDLQIMKGLTEDKMNSTGATPNSAADARATDDKGLSLVPDAFANPDEPPGDRFRPQTTNDPVEVNAVYVKDIPSEFKLPQHPHLLGKLEELWKKASATRSRLLGHPADPRDFLFILEQPWDEGSIKAKVHAEALLITSALLVHRGAIEER
ncbi:uncharacterized protein BXZ73DRAFT_80921 [Epithele typhae]|uniref:uncharacterized protein n=1 Tax=Epithele typhae TaxID=378194 RepID=UPI00200863D1|nr:uncharacterized protein BXZ73DRAFT_80921 [Epithele typhae]KAH9916948.1 hypothetical protein BXZ73DRAFT_80921 [Epithele typhae]